MSGYRKDEYNWRYDSDEQEDVMRTSTALENLQLDRKARNLTTSWRSVFLSFLHASSVAWQIYILEMIQETLETIFILLENLKLCQRIFIFMLISLYR